MAGMQKEFEERGAKGYLRWQRYGTNQPQPRKRRRRIGKLFKENNYGVISLGGVESSP